LSGRGLCDELITRPEESYRLWCAVVCDLETSRMRRPWPALGRIATAKSKERKKQTKKQTNMLWYRRLISLWYTFSRTGLLIGQHRRGSSWACTACAALEPCNIKVWAGVAQSIQRLSMGWTVRGSNPCGGRDLLHLSRTHSASCTMGTGSFSGVKRPRRGVDHPPHLAPRLKKE